MGAALMHRPPDQMRNLAPLAGVCGHAWDHGGWSMSPATVCRVLFWRKVRSAAIPANYRQLILYRGGRRS